MAKPFSFFLVTDTHYYDSSFKSTGMAYEQRSITDQKCVAETPAIIDAGFEQIAQDTDTDVILIPGDLVYRGEYQSHVGFRERLYKLKEQGKKIYIITARHDYSGNPVEFDGDKLISVKGMPREELRDFYKDFGFDSAISEHKESMSYVAQIADGIRLLALNCDGDCRDFKGLWDNQLKWALDEIKKAHDAGDYIFAMTHYPLLPFSSVMNLIGDAKLTDWEKLANEFADNGLSLIFTGHMHAQAVTDYTTRNGNTITDVQTGCFVGCPCAYRKVVIDEKKINITSHTIKDFDWDKNGKTAEEYFRWRFDRMINWKMDEILPAPAKKILDKFTLKKLGRLLCFKVDKSIENRLAKDVGIELVRNIFIGDEPYVKGTPMYEAMSKLLKRLHPITHIIEKKAAAKNPILADIDTFVLSMIGDERQRDYTAVIDR
ncbi:MAG: metallophosphoesterase [Acetobacter sp.]|nr:metallophosphoesterase [Bacteroides sp.]MCM1340207.1 metallophosphoesterase [Acetobacter sp.]MCM1432841.1 metallophosphoesterase [Clostridiales bacterium]